MLKKITLVSLAMACAAPAIAQQSAHVHGIAAINLAIDDGELEIEFVSPAESIVGFEYEPDTADERKAVEDAIALLRDPENLFELPASAECKLHEVEAERHAEGGHDEHEHEEKHAEHDEHEHEEKHAEHDEHEHEEKHAEHDEHAHEESGDSESHSEFHAHFHFDCEGSAIEEITLRLFETWPRIETVQVQALAPTGQTGGNIEANDPVIRF